ncbi:MAG: hypothetical protein LBT77_01430 [Mycoplasmataceae bacterium]|nr:hypothetical protein [Mycoplasmataceae bacterium]
MAIYLTVITSHDEDNFFINNSYVTPCSWVLVFLTYLYLSLLFLIKYYVNRAKHDLVKFRDEDFNGLLKQMQQIKFDEAKFFQKHLRYTSHIQQRYEMIMFTIQKNQNIVYDQLLADIVVFNEIFTIKWNKRYNLFQMKKFYELCIALQQKLNNTSRQ